MYRLFSRPCAGYYATLTIYTIVQLFICTCSLISVINNNKVAYMSGFMHTQRYTVEEQLLVKSKNRPIIEPIASTLFSQTGTETVSPRL